MSTFQLIILRLYNVTLGRIPILSLFLKRIMIYFLIKQPKEKYVASSRYFDYKQFEREKTG
jgi:hypothetical protein